MMHTRIVILSGHSLFAEGIASRLQQYTEQMEVVFVDPGQDEYLEQVENIQPSAVFIDALDAKITQCCFLSELLIEFPNITLVRLTVDQKDVQVISSKKRQFDDVQDLINIFLPPATSQT
jgi:DNA-binding NarL/FixJ family response regulator